MHTERKQSNQSVEDWSDVIALIQKVLLFLFSLETRCVPKQEILVGANPSIPVQVFTIMRPIQPVPKGGYDVIMIFSGQKDHPKQNLLGSIYVNENNKLCVDSHGRPRIYGERFTWRGELLTRGTVRKHIAELLNQLWAVEAWEKAENTVR